MFLKTFKGRILAVSLGMTIVSVSIFGYGLAGIYYQHMHKCLYRSLSFVTNMMVYEYDLSTWNEQKHAQLLQNPQLHNVLKGGLIDDLKIEMLPYEPISDEKRLYRYKKISEEHYFTISSSTAKIDDELVSMIASRWIFFLVGFIFTSALIYFLIRLLFAPFNQLVNHCLTCEDPDNKPKSVTGGVEIIALRDAIATLQQRISRLQIAQRDSMKALTHELKTPLAQLRLRIDLADQKGEWKADAIVAAREEIDTITQKITQILHTTESHEKSEKIYLKRSVELLVEDLRSLWEHRELTFMIDMLEEGVMVLPKASYERVIRILIENALNHASSKSQIFIHCKQGVITIQNRIGSDDKPLIYSSGKGMEIAKTLCDYYGWDLKYIQTDQEYKVELRLMG
ncbi:HAMP domain-containing sensor histidine kinase [Sulfuricurvum sp.]|uniref:sensor histidine kinase n=1 Tax=Sulfuricurvum sp. TaxID=2025608 RepID=UPI0026268C28|nr:HAMP domain-containing sensor histidine kinase [Sulfuricurvum sp.]MDD2782095.1 HAMP domain-containing sensor histidine kinase [Sulfuricurvum sp.]